MLFDIHDLSEIVSGATNEAKILHRLFRSFSLPGEKFSDVSFVGSQKDKKLQVS